MWAMSTYKPQPLHLRAPIFQTVRTYQKRWLRPDAIAGITVAAVAVPQAMAYAQLAGVPLITGLYTALIAMLVFAIFTSSRRVIVGPDAAMAALTGAVVIPLAAGNSQRATTLAATLAILIGVACFIGVILRLGFVAEFLSRPILLGYMAGLALAVIASQAPKLFGLPSPIQTNFFGTVMYVLTNLPYASYATVLLSVILIITGILLQKKLKRIPVSLVLLVGSIFASYVFNLSQYGIAIVGDIPTGLPLPQFPITDPFTLQNLIIPAMAIMLVSYANTVATTRSFAQKHSEQVNNSQEYFGLGFSNVSVGVFGGFPVAASGARTAVNEQSNAKTQVSQLFGALTIAIVLLLLAPLLGYLPVTALAVIIIMAVSKLFDLKELQSIWHAWRSEAVLAIITVIGVTFLGVLQGLLLAVFLAVANLIRKSAFPNDALLGLSDDGRVHDILHSPDTHGIPGLAIYRFDAPMYFANANHFRERVLEVIDQADDPVRWFLWDAETITSLDSTAARMLSSLISELKSKNITFAVARMKGPLKESVAHSRHLTRKFDKLPHYPSIGLAIAAYFESTDATDKTNKQ